MIWPEWSCPSRVVELHEMDLLPKASGVYAVFTSEQVLYTGQASNLWSRWQAHNVLRKLLKYNDVKLQWWIQPLWDLCYAEHWIWEHNKPLLNLNEPSITSQYLREEPWFGESWDHFKQYRTEMNVGIEEAFGPSEAYRHRVACAEWDRLRA